MRFIRFRACPVLRPSIRTPASIRLIGGFRMPGRTCAASPPGSPAGCPLSSSSFFRGLMPLWFKKKHRTLLRTGGHSDIGLVRSENQDAYGCFPEGASDAPPERLFIVADGMGGHTGGRQASRLAVATIPAVFFAHPGLPPEDRLRRAFLDANARVYGQSRALDERTRPGTTCTALALSGGLLYTAHVGDSRAYRIREGRIDLLTTDHTLVEQLRRDGLLTPEEAQRHPRRNVLNRALGVHETIDVDVDGIGPPASDDRYLLCTDGLATLSEDELLEIVSSLPPQEACERLTALANERGGRDNATAVVVHFF
ncbi:MAG: serine/threonine-protein phosphatase [Bacteroidetes bacterium]|nr:MAG: serine/threonine-protein phosphatase [Bacteroidota bacterium]